MPLSAEAVVLLLLAAYVLLGALWAPNPRADIERSALLAAITLVVLISSKSMALPQEPDFSRAMRALAVGVLIGAVFVLFELLTSGAISRSVANAITWLKPESGKRFKIIHGEVTGMTVSVFRQNVGLLSFYFWPAALALTHVWDRKRRVASIGLLVVACAIPILLSQRMSSQLALVASIIVFGLTLIWRRPVIRALAVLWFLGFVLILPIAFLEYKADLHLATWIPNSARARMIIWEFTAERVLERPWLGLGAATPSANGQQWAEQPTGFVFPRTTGAHAHNIFLQTWYDLGFIGVLLVAAAGIILILRISFVPVEAQPFLAAYFASFLATVSTTWSIWQTWLLCGAALTLLYLLIAASRPDKTGLSPIADHSGQPALSA